MMLKLTWGSLNREQEKFGGGELTVSWGQTQPISSIYLGWLALLMSQAMLHSLCLAQNLVGALVSQQWGFRGLITQEVIERCVGFLSLAKKYKSLRLGENLFVRYTLVCFSDLGLNLPNVPCTLVDFQSCFEFVHIIAPILQYPSFQHHLRMARQVAETWVQLVAFDLD